LHNQKIEYRPSYYKKASKHKQMATKLNISEMSMEELVDGQQHPNWVLITKYCHDDEVAVLFERIRELRAHYIENVGFEILVQECDEIMAKIPGIRRSVSYDQ